MNKVVSFTVTLVNIVDLLALLLGDPSGQIFYCSHLLHATHIYFTQVRSGSSRQAQHGFGASRYLPWILPQLLLRLKLMEPGRVVVFLGWSLCMY